MPYPSPPARGDKVGTHLATLSPFMQKALGEYQFSNSADLRSQLQAAKLALASDGFLIPGDKRATFGWQIQGRRNAKQAQGHGWVNSSGQPMSSLRPEIGGFLGGIIAITSLMATTFTPEELLNPVQLTVLIDNMALVSRLTKWKFLGPSNTFQPDHDHLQAAMNLATVYRINILPKHVKAHQDSDMEYKDLSWEAKMNCDCDILASEVQDCILCKSHISDKYQLPPGHEVTLVVNGIFITAHVPMAIRNAVYREKMEQYIINQAGWSTRSIFEMVDWPGHSRAGRKLSDSKRMMVFKLEFDLLAILQHRSRFDWKVNNRCPWCNHLNEDINHVIQCTDTAKSRKSLWDTDAKYMQCARLCPFVDKMFTAGMI